MRSWSVTKSPHDGAPKGRALTSHSMPALQAVLHEEDDPNHSDLFKALKYLWSQAKPNGPAFELVFRQIGKDFAPGIEAARRNELSFMRPADDFFHFMSKSREMESRCQHTTVAANGTSEKTHLGWARSVLYALQNGATPDLLDKTWRGYLRRLVCKGEIVLASYLFKEYSRILTVQELHAMNVFPNEPSLLTRLSFLPWSAGFSMFPGSNSGSQGGEAAHSPWQKKLEQLGMKWEIEDAMAFMQELYTSTWQNMYDWQNDSRAYSMLPPEGVRDPQLINGKLLASLDRSTFFDFSTKADKLDVAHLLPLDSNLFVVMPRTVEQELPSLHKARLGCQIIASHGEGLRDLLFQSGILYSIDKHDLLSIRQTVRKERLRCKENARRLHDLDTFCEALGIDEDGSCSEALFSLESFNAFFINAAYVVRDPPSGVSDTWHNLRCSCQPFSKHSGCEHIEYAKTLKIPNMQDQPNSRNNLSDPPSKKGRKRGSYTTAHGKAAAAKKRKST